MQTSRIRMNPCYGMQTPPSHDRVLGLVLGEQDVLRLHVTVQIRNGMRVFQTAPHLKTELERTQSQKLEVGGLRHPPSTKLGDLVISAPGLHNGGFQASSRTHRDSPKGCTQEHSLHHHHSHDYDEASRVILHCHARNVYFQN